MESHFLIVYLVVLPWFVMGQIPFSSSGQYGSPIVNDVLQQQQQNPVSSVGNQFQQLTNTQVLTAQSNEHYLVGNLSESFTFRVAPPSVKVTYLGLNGYSLYIMGVGFSNKSKFTYDEQNNTLTILSLDTTTVGYYSAVDANWKTFTNILSAINVSSLQIHNSHVSEDNNGSSLVSCSVSIIRSTFKLTEPNLQTKSIGTENLPRLELFASTRVSSSVLLDKKIYNDTLNDQNFTRTITLQRPLTRADHNGTIQCQVESNNNIDIYLIKTVPIDIEYGPNLETGALPTINLESEVLKLIAMECQIEANPTPSFVWYEMINNISTGQSVFGTTRQIQRLYQNSGPHAMQCQAQSRGKTVKQEFFINVLSQSNAIKMRSDIDGSQQKSSRVPFIIGIVIGSILLVLVIAIIIATIIYIKRRNITPDKKQTNEKISNDKQGKPRWGTLPIDYSKYKTESSSTSQLVESAETNSIQAPPPPIPARPSPMTSTHSSYRQAPSTSVSLSYRQASALPGFRVPPPIRSYSPEQDDDISTSMNAMPLTLNRSRINTPLGSHKSLSESIQSLRSNQQPSLSLPVKKRLNDLPTKPSEIKREHHYQNPIELQRKNDNTSSSEEEEQQQQQQFEHPKQINQISETSSGYSQVNFSQQNDHRTPSQRLVPHQLNGIHQDEVPPSYQQISNTSSPSHAYVYQEPTEV